MGVYFDSTESGAGMTDLVSPFRIFYATVDVTAFGPGVGQLGQDVADHYSRVGWFAFGDHFDTGEGAVDHWRDSIWINYANTIWTPVPSTDASGGAMAIIAGRFRWWLSPGTTAHFHVFGA